MTAPYSSEAAYFERGMLEWIFPLSERDSVNPIIQESLVAVDSVPGTETGVPTVAGINLSGRLVLFPDLGEPETISGPWGRIIKLTMYRDGPVAILVSSAVSNDVLSIVDLYSGAILAEFDVTDGPVTDVTLGDIDGDGRAEIITAVLTSDGVVIYY